MTYDPETGVFSRNGKPLHFSGDSTCYRGRTVILLRLAWELHYGKTPQGNVMPVNGNHQDRRIANLRLATNSQLRHGQRAPRTNKSGVKGVDWYAQRGCWRAQIRHGGRRIYLGLFDSLDEAARVVRAKRTELHGDYAKH